MIDKLELLKWINWLDRRINYTEHSEDTKRVHRAYMNIFREHVIDMPDVTPKNKWLNGFLIGLWTECIIWIIILALSGKI